MTPAEPDKEQGETQGFAARFWPLAILLTLSQLLKEYFQSVHAISRWPAFLLSFLLSIAIMWAVWGIYFYLRSRREREGQ